MIKYCVYFIGLCTISKYLFEAGGGDDWGTTTGEFVYDWKYMNTLRWNNIKERKSPLVKTFPDEIPNSSGKC